MKTLKVFSAEWCKPCQQYKTVVKLLDDSAVNVVIVDIDAWKDEAKNHSVRSIPTSILFSSGKEVNRKTGVMSIGELQEFVRKEVNMEGSGYAKPTEGLDD